MSDTVSIREPLTKEQQEFSALHHDKVVLGFLRRKRLPMDEFYDVIIFGYLAAVQEYDAKPELRERHAFEAVAIVRMRDSLNRYWKHINRPKRKACVYGLHESYRGHTLEESIAAETQPVEDAAEAREAWERIAPSLTQKEMDTLLLKARGFTYGEIASEQNLTRAGVQARMSRVRGKARACLAV